MSDPTQATGRPVLLSGSVGRSVRRLRVLGALIALGAVVLVIAAAVAGAVRIFLPVAGTMGAVIVAVAAAVAALAVGAVALEVLGRRARGARSMEAAVADYSAGCVVAAVANLAAGAVTVGVVAVSGISGGLWVPAALVLALNVLGLVMAMPKMKHLRDAAGLASVRGEAKRVPR